jgi:energy-converting hydrogenase Eha subunit F
MEGSFGAERHAESRFRFFINLFKIGGVSILDPSASKWHRVYCVLCYVAEYSTLIGLILEICFRTEDLDHSMDVAMLLMLFLGATFVQSYFR